MADDLAPVLNFVRSLRRNNNRQWFISHRPEYERAGHQFEVYVGALLEALRRTETLGPLTPQDCIFRLNRDLRFSRDKTPYKPYMSAYIAPGGRRSRRLGYYLHLEAGDHSILGGGLYEPERAELDAWRAAIAEDARPFRKTISAASFRRYFGGLRGERLKSAPRGYSKEHPDLELLQLKRVTIWRKVSDDLVLSPRFRAETLATFKAMRPFLDFLRDLTDHLAPRPASR